MNMADRLTREIFGRLNATYEARKAEAGEEAAQDAVRAAWKSERQALEKLSALTDGSPVDEACVSRTLTTASPRPPREELEQLCRLLEEYRGLPVDMHEVSRGLANGEIFWSRMFCDEGMEEAIGAPLFSLFASEKRALAAALAASADGAPD